MCKARAERPLSMASVLLIVAAAMIAGCSDDVVCPEPSPDMVPFVSARVAESDESSGAATTASVFCTADPLPDYLATSISGRQVNTVEVPEEPGILRTLEDDLIVWQPGVQCSLSVTTNYGFAKSIVTVPESPEVTGPPSFSLGDSLRLYWRAAPGADYYRITADAPATSGGSFVLSATTRETTHVFEADVFTATGTVAGHVDAVSGPLRESGGEGNVTGLGWGFFTVDYHDSSGTFSVEIVE
mgnify:CR=1 FL=1